MEFVKYEHLQLFLHVREPLGLDYFGIEKEEAQSKSSNYVKLKEYRSFSFSLPSPV